MLNRSATATLKQLATWYPAVALTGPRQAGKTTLAQAVFPDKPYRSLEDPDQREFALSDPRGFLAQFPGGAILDEVQRSPELFSYLRYKRARLKLICYTACHASSTPHPSRWPTPAHRAAGAQP